jgi:uncharacterized protein
MWYMGIFCRRRHWATSELWLRKARSSAEHPPPRCLGAVGRWCIGRLRGSDGGINHFRLDYSTAKPYIEPRMSTLIPKRMRRSVPSMACRLALVRSFLRNCIGEIQDERLDYREARINAFGFVDGRLFVCTYTMRSEIYRLISIRKASGQEQRIWVLL